MKPLQHASALFLLAISAPYGLAAAPQEAQAKWFENETQDAREKDLQKATLHQGTELDRGAEYVKHFGTESAKAALRVYAKIERKQATEDKKDHKRDVPVNLGIKGGVAVDALLFGAYREVAHVGLKTSIADVESPDSKSSGKSKNKSKKGSSAAAAALKEHLDIRIAGFTVEIPSAAAGSNQKIPPRQILPTDVKANFTIGPVPCVIRANGGLGTNLEFGPSFDTASRSLVLKASAEAYLNGWVSAGVGFDCGVAAAVAGVKADLRLLNIKAELGLGVSPVGWTGDLALELRALTIRLLLFAEAKLAFFKIGWEMTLFQVSFGLVRVEIPFLDTRPQDEEGGEEEEVEEPESTIPGTQGPGGEGGIREPLRPGQRRAEGVRSR